MKSKLTIATALIFALGVPRPETATAEVVCKIKKTGALISRPSKCTKKEVQVTAFGLAGNNATIVLQGTANSSSAETKVGTDLSLEDSGAVSSGSDINTGLDVSVSRTGATGGTINTTGLNVAVSSDGGGDATNVGLAVSTSGGDANYCAIFQGGNVGIGVSDPDEQLELTGRIHLGQTSAPDTVSDRLYNVGGLLYWNGQALSTGGSSGGTITSVTAGTGLTGGGSSGAIALSVDTGTSANDIVQLNSSGELPSVSGYNLTALRADNIASGVLSDSRLSSNVSLLGSSISLASEVSSTLPIANGGTGATSLSNLITLSTHTSGNYVASVANGTGISGGASGSEAAALTLSVDQTFSPTWTGTHSFQGNVNVGTTTASIEALHLNGRMQIEPIAVPTVTTNKLYNVAGDLYFNGENLSANAAGGDITGVTASTGLIGGGTSGDVTISVDVGTGNNQIVQLNGSGALPALNGANLTSLSASQLSSGTVPTARLPGTVTLLGTAIGLTNEVEGILPVANGGTGAASLADLLTLGTHTQGNYVASISGTSGITSSSSGAEGGTTTLSLNQAFSPVWTASHQFSGVSSDITTPSNENFSIVPNGTGKIGLGTTSPSAMVDAVYSSTSTSASTERGMEVNLTDTGILSTGTDATLGLEVNVARTGALTGSTIENTGLDISVTGDTGGTSLNTGLVVSVSGADTNYAALFSGGNVGIGTTTPAAAIDSRAVSTSTASGTTERGGRIAIQDTGVVTSGTDTTYGLDVSTIRTGPIGGTINSTALNIVGTGDTGGTSTMTGLSVSVTGADTNYAALFNGGSVGIGTAAPSASFETIRNSAATTGATETAAKISVIDAGIVNSGGETDTTYGLDVVATRTGATLGTINTTALNITGTGDAGGTSSMVGLAVSVSGADTNIAATFTGGSIGLGDTTAITSAVVPSGSMVVGNGILCVDDGGTNCDDGAPKTAGSIYAESTSVTGIDVAEEFPLAPETELAAGELVMADSRRAPVCRNPTWDSAGNVSCAETEMRMVPFITRATASRIGKKRLLGVISTAPGLTLGGFGHEDLAIYRKLPVALAGRVPVKVSLEGGPIEVGDRIGISSTPGIGMRVDDDEPAVGIALEPLDADNEAARSSGTIVVFIR